MMVLEKQYLKSFNAIPSKFAFSSNICRRFIHKIFHGLTSMKSGDSLELSKIVTELDIDKLIEISGDDNPIHTDEEFAKRTLFKGRIAHGIISAALVSAALTKFFGPGNVWMSQTIKYTFPVRIGDTITAKLRIIAIDKRKVYTVETKVYNQDDRLVLDGVAESKVMRVQSRS